MRWRTTASAFKPATLLTGGTTLIIEPDVGRTATQGLVDSQRNLDNEWNLAPICRRRRSAFVSVLFFLVVLVQMSVLAK